ncbi:DnaD domain protein [Atopobacter phocae]|uniref:DnaD domain protein n=1 Tax=Atopobacter phocae TaxID=136492 RepID=UPI0004717F2F|nr:DnaD domain protein [Atopobacter phocae]
MTKIKVEDLRITPMTPIQLRQVEWITPLHLKWLTLLYQPFLGVVSTQLYHSFCAWIYEEMWESEVMSVSFWLEQCDMSLAHFSRALNRLESLRLVKVYWDQQIEQYWIELQGPLAPEVFFKDELLVSLLKDTLSHEHFHQLKARCTITDLPSHVVEVTRPFESIFSLPVSIQANRGGEEAPTGMRFLKTSQLEEPIDWGFILQGLVPYGMTVNHLTNEVRQTLNVLHRYYRLNAIDIPHYLLASFDEEEDEVDVSKLKNVIIAAHPVNDVNQQVIRQRMSEDFEQYRQQAETTPAVVPSQIAKQPAKKKQAIAVSTELLKAFKEIPPQLFLSTLKNQMNGIVESSEESLVRNALGYEDIPSEVINVLIYYILVIYQNKKIHQNFFDAILNTWRMEKISSAEEAIEATIHFKKAQSTPDVKPARQSNKRFVREEKLPDWAKEAYQPKEVSPEEKQQLEQHIQSIQRKKRKDKDKGGAHGTD